MSKVTIETKPIRDKVKDKEDWKSMSSSEKDELLYQLCLDARLIPKDMPYEKL